MSGIMGIIEGVIRSCRWAAVDGGFPVDCGCHDGRALKCQRVISELVSGIIDMIPGCNQALPVRKAPQDDLRCHTLVGHC